MIEVRHLSVRFGDAVALKGFSFRVDTGECLCIVGESGSGKTQTSLALMGLSPAGAKVSGEIDRGGAKLALVFQDPLQALTPHLTIGTQIGEVLKLHRRLTGAAARTEALRWLELVRIAEPTARLKAYPHELSGGMRQRVLIAMALMAEPDLVILDEPTSALDTTVQAGILALLAELKQRLNLTMILITHDMGVAATLADRVAVLKKGEFVEEGTAAELFAAPREAYTRQLLAAVPRLDAPGAGTPPNAAPLLEARDLCLNFALKESGWFRTRHFAALDQVSLAIAPGETLAVVGLSGSGKSTLARAILDLTPPDTGEILWEGQPRAGLSPLARFHQRRDLAAVFQDPRSSLNPRRRVGDSIAEPLRLHHPGLSKAEIDKRVAAALTDVELDPAFAHRRPGELSGGQAQRVALARALILKPKLIVLDEALSALDVSVQAKIADLLARLQREQGMAYLFISHDLGIVRKLAHRIAVMDKGRIVECAEADAFFREPESPLGRELLAAVPSFDQMARTGGCC